MRDMKCNCGVHVVGHILALIGVYILTWGLVGAASFGIVLKSPIFWGLVLILAGNCKMNHMHKMK